MRIIGLFKGALPVILSMIYVYVNVIKKYEKIKQLKTKSFLFKVKVKTNDLKNTCTIKYAIFIILYKI